MSVRWLEWLRVGRSKEKGFKRCLELWEVKLFSHKKKKGWQLGYQKTLLPELA